MMDTFASGVFNKTDVKKPWMNLVHLQQKQHNSSFVTILQKTNQYTKIK